MEAESQVSSKLKGRHFDTTEVMEAESQAALTHLKTVEGLGTVHTV
jgi:hypothetical protein